MQVFVGNEKKEEINTLTLKKQDSESEEESISETDKVVAAVLAEEAKPKKKRSTFSLFS